MGNVNTKKEEESIDGGGFSPYGIYSGPQDFDHRGVKKLIQDRRIAAFYKGLPDLESLKTNVASNNRNGGTKRRSNSVRSRDSTAKLTMADLYRGAVECPICFLYYPRNINHSRCCEQPICTECFVQIKRPEATGTPAVCPFCVRPHFGVIYTPPKDVLFFLQGPSETQNTSDKLSTDLRPTMAIQHGVLDSQHEENHRRKVVSHDHPDVVTSDDIRPDYVHRLEMQSHTIANAARLLSGEASTTSLRLTIPRTPGDSNRHPSRQNDQRIYLSRIGEDLEEMMVMEAIRQSIIEEQEREERERHEKQVEREAQEALQRQSKTNTTETLPSPDPQAIKEIETSASDLEIQTSESHTTNANTSDQHSTIEHLALEDSFNDTDIKNPIHCSKNGLKEIV